MRTVSAATAMKRKKVPVEALKTQAEKKIIENTYKTKDPIELEAEVFPVRRVDEGQTPYLSHSQAASK